MQHKKCVECVCVPSIDFVVAFSHYLFIHFPYAPKASLCAESKSQKSYALVGLPKLAILTLADNEEGTACCDFLLQARSSCFMAFIH